jgi:hypothetical protein
MPVTQTNVVQMQGHGLLQPRVHSVSSSRGTSTSCTLLSCRQSTHWLVPFLTVPLRIGKNSCFALMIPDAGHCTAACRRSFEKEEAKEEEDQERQTFAGSCSTLLLDSTDVRQQTEDDDDLMVSFKPLGRSKPKDQSESRLARLPNEDEFIAASPVTFYDIQLDAIRWMYWIERSKKDDQPHVGGILGDVMGLGKTIDALGLIIFDCFKTGVQVFFCKYPRLMSCSSTASFQPIDRH